MTLACITPHGKWHIHSTYADDLRMLTLSRGIEPLWLNDQDAAEMEVQDNDWVETYNDNGVVVTRAVVSARIPRGLCILYHAPERTIAVPKAPMRDFKRAGGTNSLTPAANKAGPDGGRLCATDVPVQRLWSPGIGPRHFCDRPQTGR